jgi:hypothetical protein
MLDVTDGCSLLPPPSTSLPPCGAKPPASSGALAPISSPADPPNSALYSPLKGKEVTEGASSRLTLAGAALFRWRNYLVGFLRRSEEALLSSLKYNVSAGSTASMPCFGQRASFSFFMFWRIIRSFRARTLARFSTGISECTFRAGPGTSILSIGHPTCTFLAAMPTSPSEHNIPNTKPLVKNLLRTRFHALIHFLNNAEFDA